jgi:hypothetical protein
MVVRRTSLFPGRDRALLAGLLLRLPLLEEVLGNEITLRRDSEYLLALRTRWGVGRTYDVDDMLEWFWKSSQSSNFVRFLA